MDDRNNTRDTDEDRQDMESSILPIEEIPDIVEFDEETERNDAIDTTIMQSINQLLDASTKNTNVQEDYHNYKIQTKKLLEQLLIKLEENSIYERSLKETIRNLETQNQAKLTNLSEYLESIIDKTKIEADERYMTLLNRYEIEQNDRIALERTIFSLTKENWMFKV